MYTRAQVALINLAFCTLGTTRHWNRAASGIITDCVCVCVCQTETRSRAGKIHPQCKNRLTALIPAAFGRFFHYTHTLYSLSIYIYTCTVCDWKHKRTTFQSRGQWTIYSHASPLLHFYISDAVLPLVKGRKTDTRGPSPPGAAYLWASFIARRITWPAPTFVMTIK